MPGLQTSEFGLVSRALPQPTPDGVEREQRLTRYGGTMIENVIPTKHALADEGAYFVANNGQTAVSGVPSSGFNSTHPTISIYNSDSAGNASAKRIYIDYIYLLAGGTSFTSTASTGVFVTVILDSQNGLTVTGTALTPVCTNMDMGTKSIATVNVGNLTAPTNSSNARTIVGQRLVRAPMTSATILAANTDQFLFNFGGVDIAMALPNAASTSLEPNMVGRTINLPPIVIGPGQSAWVYIVTVTGGAVTAGNYVPEIGWWER